MVNETPQNQAVEELQQFGLREYEAKCFVSLTKITSGTAREVSEHIDIPRTRVYEAVRSLESDGLVEIQHSSPQQFRAIPIAEAIEILTQRYRRRIESIEQSLTKIRQSSNQSNPRDEAEVWSIVGGDTISTRVKHMVDDADSEVLLLVGDTRVLTKGVYQTLTEASKVDVDIVVGAASSAVREQLSGELPSQMVFHSDLSWLQAGNGASFSIGRLLLVDNCRLLASSILEGEDPIREQAVCGSGSRNGLVAIVQNLLRQQLQL